MKPSQLREELSKRGLDTSGEKTELEQRLKKALEADALVLQQLTEGSKSPGGSGGSSGSNKRKHEDAGQGAGAGQSRGDQKQSIAQQLECPVCMDLIHPPIYQCEVVDY